MPYALYRIVRRPYYFNHVMALQMVGAKIEVLPYALCLMPYALYLPYTYLMPYRWALNRGTTLRLMPYTYIMPYAL